MIFNNFLSASLSTAYPKEKFTSRSYTASNRLLKKEIKETSSIDLYWKFYDELMNVLTFSRLFPDTEEQNRYKEYREVYLDISRLRANDNNRKKLIEKYEEILKKCKKIY